MCPDETCVLNVGINPIEKRMEALEKLYKSFLDEREGGMLTPPSLGHLLCVKCMKTIEPAHTIWGSECREKYANAFGCL